MTREFHPAVYEKRKEKTDYEDPIHDWGDRIYPGDKKGLIIKGVPTKMGVEIAIEAETHTFSEVASRYSISTGLVATLFRLCHDGLSKDQWKNLENYDPETRRGRPCLLFDRQGNLNEDGQAILDHLQSNGLHATANEFKIGVGVIRGAVNRLYGMSVREWKKSLKGG